MSGKLTPEDVKAIRAARRWSTKKLADYLGCNQSTVWRMEQGGNISGPSEKLLRTLLPASGIDNANVDQAAS